MQPIQMYRTRDYLHNIQLHRLFPDYLWDEEAQLANEQAAKQEAAYRQFATSITNEIRGLNSFAGQELELSDEDSEELAAFMLELDESGTSAFGRALQDPNLFTKAAFWLLNEEQIIEELSK